LISGWNKRWLLIRKMIHDNPEDFGYGLASYWPIPTWSAWTTYPPVLRWLEDVFKDELNLDLDLDSKKFSSSMEVEEEIVTPLEEGSRKGSVGLGIVGVDVVKPNPNSSSRSNSLVDPAKGSSIIDIKEGEKTREDDFTEEKPVRDGFFPVNYAMTAITMTTDPIQPPTSTSTSTSMLGAREPRSPSSTDIKSPNPNQSPGMGMTMGRRFTASSLHPDDRPQSQTQSPNADNIPTSTSTEPMLIPFTPFPKSLTSTSSSDKRSWASRARRLLLYTYTRLAAPVCLVAMGFALGVTVWQAGQSWGKVWTVVFGRGEHGIATTGGKVGAGQKGTGMGGLGKRGLADDQGLGLQGVMDEGYGYRPEGGNVVQALVSPVQASFDNSLDR
jgi:hypothetical protein